jgi:hypothetical protein
MPSDFSRNPLFFCLVLHLTLFGSEKVILLTVKNLLIASGGPNRPFFSVNISRSSSFFIDYIDDLIPEDLLLGKRVRK